MGRVEVEDFGAVAVGGVAVIVGVEEGIVTVELGEVYIGTVAETGVNCEEVTEVIVEEVDDVKESVDLGNTNEYVDNGGITGLDERGANSRACGLRGGASSLSRDISTLARRARSARGPTERVLAGGRRS